MYLIIGVRIAYVCIRGMVSLAGVMGHTAFFVGMVSPIIFDFIVCDVGCQ